MAFTGWENAKTGEEFSVDEITQFYGSIGPYSLLERPRRSLWGRCPLMAKCIVKNGVPGKFEPGAKVIAFLSHEGNNCTVAAFPEALFEKQEMRAVVASAEMYSMKNSPVGGLWSIQYNARLFVQPYTPSLRELEPPYSLEDMDGVFKKLAEKHGSYGDFALASELFATGAEYFAHFAFALAKSGADDAHGIKLHDAWDVVLLFFGKPPQNAVLSVPLRGVAFWDGEKLAKFAGALARESSVKEQA